MAIARLRNEIRKRRLDLGLTQEALAKRARLHRNTIATIETGIVPDPGIGTVKAIARALRCTIDDLVTRQKRGHP